MIKDSKKNPYDPSTPEWQLFENARSSDSLANAASQEAEKATERAKAAREKAEKYWIALEKLASVTTQ